MTKTCLHTLLCLLLLSAGLPVAAQSDDIDVLLDEDLSTEESFARFTVVNANQDSQTWMLGLQGACIRRTSAIGHDDYLVTPEVTLRRGRTYTLRYTAKCIVEGPEERLTVRLGQGTSPDAFTTIVALERGFSQKADEMVEHQFTVAADGSYRLALHDVSARSAAQSFYVRDLSLTVPVSPLSPQPVGELTVTPDAAGALCATISFLAPELTRGGQPLTAIDAIEVWRDEQLVATVSQPLPGARLTVSDEGEGMDAPSMVTYTVRTLNSEGHSTATAQTYVGEDFPKAPAWATLRDDGQHIVASWEAVSEGIRGYSVNAAAVTYCIEDAATGVPIATGLSSTTYTLPVPAAEGVLQQHRYVVYAQTTAGPGPSVATNRLVSGQPLALPLMQSFGVATWPDAASWWTTYEQSSWDEWQRDDDSSDGDGASLLARPYSSDEHMGLHTAKLDLRGSMRPCIVFSHKAEAGQPTRISLWADVPPQGSPQLLYSYGPEVPEVPEALDTPASWQREAVDLSAYKDQPYVVLSLVAESPSGVAVALDDIAIYDVPLCDLTPAIALPKKTRTGRQTDIQVQLRNLGSTTAEGARLQLKAAGDTFCDMSLPAIAPYATVSMTVGRTALVTDPAQLAIEAVVTCDADVDDSNDTAMATMRIEQTTLPTVPLLTGHDTGSAVELSWQTPEQTVDYTTEDFESYDAFAADLSPWTTIDADGLPIFSVEGVSFPQNGQAMSFVVFNPIEAGWNAKDNPTTMPRSGNQYAASFAPDDWYAQNDDWLVSPLLTAGEEQTVSFFARSVSSYYGGDGFDILYSTTGCQPADFTYKCNETPCEATEDRWTEFFADLPAEARYFAIHYNAPGTVGLLVDDVTYLAPTPAPTGYNIYRDRQLIAHVGATTYYYKDTQAPAGRHTYYVTATYATGESDLSAPYAATVATSVPYVATVVPAASTVLRDLQGRPLSRPPRHGIYLRGNRKTLVR